MQACRQNEQPQIEDEHEFMAAQVLAGFAWPAPPPQVTEGRRRAVSTDSSNGGSSTTESMDSDGDGAKWTRACVLRQCISLLNAALFRLLVAAWLPVSAAQPMRAHFAC